MYTDAIVQEVKESEEWEDAQMSILSIGIEKGREEGMEKARRQMARNLFRRGFPAEETAELTEVPHPVVQSWYREWEKQ